MLIKWTNGASRNLDGIEEFIAQDNPRAAAKTVLRLVRRVHEQLSLYPASGKPGRIKGTREMVFSDPPYVVVYMVRGDTIYVVRVFHAAQQINGG